MHIGSFHALLFGVVSLFLLSLSWKSLRVPHSHGFYRFFAWEAILALILINSHAWFSDPLSLRQIASWILLLLSLVLLGLGLRMIRMAGKPGDQRRDGTLLGFEKTTTLVTTGIYGYIRHPLYGSLLFLAWGALLKEVTWSSAGLGVLVTVFLVATARADEAECVRYFGRAYEEYKTRTKMFVPGLF
jgi:protein-S-isoprenylcysteine O-methyltransferase Ste14